MSEQTSYVNLERKERTDIIIQYFNSLDIGRYNAHKEYGNYDVDIDYTDKIDGNRYSWFVDECSLQMFYSENFLQKNKPQVIDKNSWVNKFNKILSK